MFSDHPLCGESPHRLERETCEKITRLGLISTAGASAAALAVAGFALPASADTWNPSEETTTTVTEASTSIEGFQTWFRENVLGAATTPPPATSASTAA